MSLRNFLVAAVIAGSSTVAMAAMSSSLVEWGKGPAQLLMTKEEAKTWKSIRNDHDARAFVELFWARRDPTPGTPRNEYREAFEERGKFADTRFAFGKTKGSLTDRGRYFVVLGVPTRAATPKPAAGSSIAAPGPTTDPMTGQPADAKLPTEIWYYEKEHLPRVLGTKPIEVTFVDSHGTGDFRLGRSKSNIADAIARISTSVLSAPGLTQVPRYETAAPPVKQVEVSIPAPVITGMALKNASLLAAVETYKTSRSTPTKGLHLTFTEGVTPTGEYYVPVQLYLTRDVQIPADKPVTFFGVVEDSNGKAIAGYEEPAKLIASKNDLFYDKSLVLPSGVHKGYFGLAADGKVIAMGDLSLALTSLDKDSPGISRLLISNNIYPLTVAQLPTDPFAYGGIKVIAKGDRTFTRNDELWYFFELRNPGTVAPAAAEGAPAPAAQPKVQAKLDIEGNVTKIVDGKTTKTKVVMGRPLSELEVEPLKGVPGHYGAGAALPLTTFAPGDYVIKLKVIDTVRKQTYNLEEKFKVE